MYEVDDARELKQDQVRRIRRVLGVLDSATVLENIELVPGLRLHGLKGDLAGFWSVSISGNWRIIFKYEDGQAFDVDLVDYH